MNWGKHKSESATATPPPTPPPTPTDAPADRPEAGVQPPRSLLRWADNEHLAVGRAGFFLTLDPDTWKAASKPDRFIMLKNRPMVEFFCDHTPEPAQVNNIVDLGIFKGGSVALYHELFSPNRIVGVDLSPWRVKALDTFVERNSLRDSVRLYYDTDQGDQELLSKIVADNFGKDQLDLVVDDCSHLYGPTKASLNVLLPRLRPGGVYLIEDWGWAHWSGEYWQGTDHQYVDETTPLSKLIFEVVMLQASRPSLIRDVTIRRSEVYITRGDEQVSFPDFDISASYLTAGRQIFL